MSGTGARNRYHKRDRKLQEGHYSRLKRNKAGQRGSGIAAQKSNYPS